MNELVVLVHDQGNRWLADALEGLPFGNRTQRVVTHHQERIFLVIRKR